MSKNTKGAESVKVVVRCRPMNEKETKDGHERIVDMTVKKGVVEVRNPKGSSSEPPKTFTFDAVYDWDSKQQDLYDETVHDLVECVLQGFNGTIFAYGQTGTGKTFTMQGVKSSPELMGVIPRSFDHVFNHISRSENQQYLVRASYLEIYQEEIRDLLSKDQSKRLELKERPDTGVYVKDLSSFVTKSVREIEHVMNVGNQNRSVGATNMNEHSSRSHAIFIVTVECSEIGADGENHIRVGKLNMVDLAGSERQAKTGATGDRLKEATKINLSLSALSNVISALVDAKTTHIPYRDSKLTRLLQDSLGGNSKTTMVANIGPASYNFDETLTTLRYANRAKSIKNKPKINEDPKDALLREFQEEINRLKNQLSAKGGPKKKKKKRTRRTRDGQIIEDGDEEESEDDEAEGGEANAEAYMQEQMARLDQEKSAILNNQSLIAEEKERLLSEMQEKEEKLSKEKEQRDALAVKIKAMESKLLMGGKNIVDHTNEQQRALEQRRQEILEQARKEREIQQKLEEKEESAVEIKETYNSLQQEVEVKTKKLKKMFGKLQATKAEIQDLQEEHTKERQELEQTLMELTRELKLKYLIIENFIPPEEKTKLMNRAVYDEDEDAWVLRPLANKNTQTMAKRPVSALGNKRPQSEFARQAGAMGGNPRFKGENILNMELDMPNRTTRDYEGPAVAPKVQAALDAALQDEADIDIDGGAAVITGKGRLKRKSARPKTASKRVEDQKYPSSRGLVPK
ncbi:kinesin-like protein KIF3B isoform X2 [Babylonia areolata]|uniref:kinesin-like protein KIF3B isoform X2 n=1 Tax=Babylonia areolata TaxID=304850 RepID=UPI003FD44E04